MSVSLKQKKLLFRSKETSFPVLRTSPIGFFIKRQSSDTSSDNRWQRVTTNYNSSVY